MPRSSIGWALLCLCFHCGGQTKTAPTTEEAPPVPSSVPEADSQPSEGSEATATGAAADPVAPPASATGSSKPTCDKLAKTTCQITTGCAWNDLKKCVADGP